VVIVFWFEKERWMSLTEEVSGGEKVGREGYSANQGMASSSARINE